MDDFKPKSFDQFYSKNKNLLQVLNAPDNAEIYQAFWDARNDEISELLNIIREKEETILQQAVMLKESNRKVASYEKTERILKQEIHSTGQHILTLNENINLQGQEIEKLETTVVEQERLAQDLRFVISEQKSEKAVLSQTIKDFQNQVIDLEKEIAEYQKRENIIKSELKDISSRTHVIEQTSREQIQYLIEKNEKLQEALVQRDNAIAQSQRYTDEYRTINNRLSDELMRLRSKVKRISREGPAALLDCH